MDTEFELQNKIQIIMMNLLLILHQPLKTLKPALSVWLCRRHGLDLTHWCPRAPSSLSPLTVLPPPGESTLVQALCSLGSRCEPGTGVTVVIKTPSAFEGSFQITHPFRMWQSPS